MNDEIKRAIIVKDEQEQLLTDIHDTISLIEKGLVEDYKYYKIKIILSAIFIMVGYAYIMGLLYAFLLSFF